MMVSLTQLKLVGRSTKESIIKVLEVSDVPLFPWEIRDIFLACGVSHWYGTISNNLALLERKGIVVRVQAGWRLKRGENPEGETGRT
jgi:hypothetical protein